MKTFPLIAAAVMAATMTIGVAAPTPASAETIIIKKHRGHDFRRAHDFYHPRWHRHHGRDRTVIIKKGGYRHDY